MKSILISIKPKWCALIANGRKTIEVRKTRPKLEAPFKCYIYCTKDKGISLWTGKRYAYADDRSHNLFDVCGNGKVIGEFVCDAIYDCRDVNRDDTCITVAEWLKYTKGHKGEVYGWHISNIVIYDKPKELSEFAVTDKEAIQQCEYREQSYYAFTDTGYIKNGFYCKKKDDWCFGECKRKVLTRPPQSWCYVEEVEE